MADTTVQVVDGRTVVTIGGTELLAPLVAAAAASAAAAEAAAGNAAAGVAAATDEDRIAAQDAAASAAADAATLSGMVEALTLGGDIGLPASITPITGSTLAAGLYAFGEVLEQDVRIYEVHGYSFATRTFDLYVASWDGLTWTMDSSEGSISVTGAGAFTKPVNILLPAGKRVVINNPATSLSSVVAAAYSGGHYTGAAFPFDDATATTTTRIQVGFSYDYQAVTTAVLDDVSALDTRMRQIEGAFTLSANKNLFNPALCLDNYYHSTSNAPNADQAFPGRISLGAQVVESGKSYVYSINDDVGFQTDKRFICRNAAGAFLGYSSGAGGIAPNPPVLTWIDDRTVAFTIPGGSTTAKVGITTRTDLLHTTEDFERIVASIQLEEGTEKTALEPPSPDGMARLNALNLPDAGEDVTFAGTLEGSRGFAERAGANLYVRTWYDVDFDLVQRIALMGGTSTTAEVVNPGGVRLVARDVKNAQGGFNDSTAILAAQGDDAGPYNYGGTYVGGNHGVDDLRRATVTAHGKTILDVGSRWIDGSGFYWIIMDIPTVNSLDLMSENQSAYPAWSFRTSLSGTLTHVSGATNTGSIVLGAVIGAQLQPAVNTRTFKVMVDGEEMADDFAMAFEDTVTIAESYKVSNPADMVEIAKAHVGSAALPDYDALGVESDLSVTLSYAITPNGAMTLASGGHTINTLTNFAEFTLTQAVALTVGGTDKRYFHVPRTVAFSIGANAYDLEAGHEITTPPADLVELTVARWSDPADPPSELAQIITTSGGVLKQSFCMGFNEERGVGIPANRATDLGKAGYIKVDAKMYPGAINSTGSGMSATLGANYHFGGLAFRGWTLPGAPAPIFFWYPAGTDVFVVARWPDAITADVVAQRLPLPDRFVGRKVTVIREEGGATVHSRDMVLAEGLFASVTGGGGVVVKLT